VNATYRLQLRPEFGFDAAAGLADYLAALGVSHVYCSPYLQAARGSAHGYDVVDHSRVNVELGGAEAHDRLVAALAANGLGQVLDIVPNHMAVDAENAWWWDVLENGPASRFATHFDVDWDPPEARLRNTVLLPILGTHYGEALDAGEIRLVFSEGWFALRYADQALPVAPPSLDTVLALAAGALGSDELAFIGAALGRLPRATATDRVSVYERWRDAQVLRGELRRLCDENPDAATAITDVVDTINREPDALDALVERQNYRLAYWRTAGQDLDYRRFFDITSLVGLRVEDERVFADTHRKILEWVAGGVIGGLRIDHIDGLRDPKVYLERLRAEAGSAWLVVEKILAADEELPRAWPVDGTTGYDALNMVGGLFVDPAGERPLSDLYAELTGDARPFDEIAYDAKQQVLRDVLGADLNRLTHLFVQVAERHRRFRDYTRQDLREALREMLACFPVYRTYPGDGADTVAFAVKRAGDRRPDLDAALLELLAAVLVGAEDDPLVAELRLRFQQLAAPVMAKGVEDTAFYRYHRLIALNEVGGAPDRFGVSAEAFHRWAAGIAEQWPRTMTTLSTHDTKRSEDVRARLFVLSERPIEWGQFARRWVDGTLDGATQYLLLQSVVGAWPLPFDRAWSFAQKAIREAKVHTSWTDRHADYEDAVRAWLSARYADAEFVADAKRLVATIGPAGRVKAVAQKLVQLMMPGEPDIYQGCEIEDFSLVDPDNRRPVDFALRRQLLASGDDVLREREPKLLVVRVGLAARRRHRLGEGAAYTPLPTGPRTLGFVRGDRLAVAVPLRGARAEIDVELPLGDWRDLLPGLAVSLYERVD